MPRNMEQNAQLREDRKKQILDSALFVYIRCGYHGIKMNQLQPSRDLPKVYYTITIKPKIICSAVHVDVNIHIAVYAVGLVDSARQNHIQHIKWYPLPGFSINLQSVKNITGIDYAQKDIIKQMSGADEKEYENA